MNCRFCRAQLSHLVIDLGFAPPSNSYLSNADLAKSQLYSPLRVQFCEHCQLVQTEDYTTPEHLFDNDYAYFSSTSHSWLSHARRYFEMICRRYHLDGNSFVIEVASNDGYLLRNFVSANIPCLGIEPTASTASAAETIGIPVLREFFSHKLAQSLCDDGRQADLIIGNNVYAHVPEIADFTAGIATLLKKDGIVTLEFPHLLNLVKLCQFDTIYHEHFSYLSLNVVQNIFRKNGLKVIDVESLPTHGGSLRVYGALESSRWDINDRVTDCIEREIEFGLDKFSTYITFQQNANQIKNDFISFLIDQAQQGKKVAGYGAAAKGNTLLNFCGIRSDLMPMVGDSAASKIGKYLPGSAIPIVSEQTILDFRPDYLVIFPWNIAAEIESQLSMIRDWNGSFVTVIPKLTIF